MLSNLVTVQGAAGRRQGGRALPPGLPPRLRPLQPRLLAILPRPHPGTVELETWVKQSFTKISQSQGHKGQAGWLA